ncbi:MAG: UDP-glucose:undecaprenyl-phosphate glucose-1-phosphate transferase [Chlamydiae bacterium]|nr:UDP-glucose:undecaprenyl-phosphate glucose-1-phosphate transferase [Chlamydiota bacterium]
MSAPTIVQPRERTTLFFGKRLFDLSTSVAFLLCLSPLYLILILLVKVTSKGPALYKGLRMGKGGRLFYCWKFRTMCVDADERLHRLLSENPQMQKEWETFFKLKNDPRLTVIGKFLRRSSLDELPQIWNVVKGELSLVGPRPIAIESRENAREEIDHLFGEFTDKILSVKPGVTCIWQTRGRNLLTFQERIQLEIEYIDHQSFWLDLKILFKTIPVLLFPKGAF